MTNCKRKKNSELKMRTWYDNLKIGDFIVCEGNFAVIREIQENGKWIVENPRLGKWVTTPDKCRDYDPFPLKL